MKLYDTHIKKYFLSKISKRQITKEKIDKCDSTMTKYNIVFKTYTLQEKENLHKEKHEHGFHKRINDTNVER
jgi:hypothetical protein